MTILSVVLITRNQAWNVDRLIESVLRETAAIADCEIVLVDSASSDGTARRAARHPIRALRLRDGQPLTAAAGRFVGYRQTGGAFVLFLDGDMELRPGWLRPALDVMRDDPRIAAISGWRHDLPKHAVSPAAPGEAAAPGGLRDIPHGGGAALYRRSALEQAGTFNPCLSSDEEPELCLRLRRAGFRVVQAQRPMVYHYSDPDGTIRTMLRRRQRGLYLGAGQCLRYHLGDEFFWPYLRERGFGLAVGVALLAGAVSLVAGAARRQWRWPAFWAALLVAAFAADARRKRSPYRALASLVQRALIFDGTVRGFLLEPGDPARYEAEWDWIGRPVLA